MVLVCYDRPNRTKPRRYSGRDAGRIICYAMENGASLKEINQAARDRGCGDVFDDECAKVKVRVREMLELALAVLAAILLSLTAAGRIVRIALPFLSRYLPARVVRALQLERLGTVIEGEFRRVDDLASEIKVFISKL